MDLVTHEAKLQALLCNYTLKVTLISLFVHIYIDIFSHKDCLMALTSWYTHFRKQGIMHLSLYISAPIKGSDSRAMERFYWLLTLLLSFCIISTIRITSGRERLHESLNLELFHMVELTVNIASSPSSPQCDPPSPPANNFTRSCSCLTRCQHTHNILFRFLLYNFITRFRFQC